MNLQSMGVTLEYDVISVYGFRTFRDHLREKAAEGWLVSHYQVEDRNHYAILQRPTIDEKQMEAYLDG